MKGNLAEEARASAEAEENKLAAEIAKAAPVSNKTEITRKIAERVEQAKPDHSHAEMFSMMQTLVKGLADQQRDRSALPVNMPVVAPGQTDLASENADLKQQQAHLMSLLTDIQSRLNLGDTSSNPPGSSTAPALKK